MSQYQGDSIFWVEVDRINPNPFQPRRSFDEGALVSLAESIRQYGVMQPLTVTRKETFRPNEGMFVEYELIAGERRLRASKLAGLLQVPVVIRTAEDTDRMKLELAIIENLQREDLNPIDRAEAFKQLSAAFGLNNVEIGKRVGKSREYVSNTLRILNLPEEMREAVRAGSMSEGHTRPLLMLIDKPAEQMVLFKDIVTRRISVRDAEAISRRISVEKARNKASVNPDLMILEKQLSEKLGTRVRIEKKDMGGKVTIDFFSPEDLTSLCMTIATAIPAAVVDESPLLASSETAPNENSAVLETAPEVALPNPPEDEDPDLYSLSNFSV